MYTSTNQELLMFAHCRMNKTASIKKEAVIYNAVRKLQSRMAANPAAQPVLSNVTGGARTVAKNPASEQVQQVARELGNTAPSAAEKAIVNTQLATGAADAGLRKNLAGAYENAGNLLAEGQIGLGTNVSQLGRRMTNNPEAGTVKKWIGEKIDETGDAITQGHYTGTPPPAVGAMANTIGPASPALSATVGIPTALMQYAAEKAGVGAAKAAPYVRDGAKAIGRPVKEQVQKARFARAVEAEQRAAAQAALQRESSLAPEARRMMLDKSDPLLNRKLSPNISFAE